MSRLVVEPELKRCTQCKQWKNREDDFVQKLTKYKLVDGTVREKRYPAPECKKCAAKRRRRWGRKLKDEGRFKEHQARWESVRDPKLRRAYYRKWYRRSRGEAFTLAWKRYRHELETEPERQGEFCVKPIADFIDRFIVEELVDGGAQVLLNGYQFSESDRRLLRRWKSGKTKTTTLVTLDRLATKYELPFWELEEVGRMAA